MDTQLEKFLQSQCERIIKILAVTAGPGMHKLNEITPNIWISSRNIAYRVDELKDYDIKTIINLSTILPEKTLRQYRRRHMEFHHIPIEDLPNQNIREALTKSYDIIIASAIQQQKVLVHCDSGVSRAATIVIGYMLRRSYLISFEKYKRHQRIKKGLDLLKELINPTNIQLLSIIKFIKASRPCIEPNPGFVWQLILYEQYLKKSYAPRIQELFSNYKHKSRKHAKNHTLEDSNELNIFDGTGESSSHSSDFESASDNESLGAAFDEVLNKKQSPVKTSKKTKHKSKKQHSDVKINIKDTLADIRAMDMSLGSEADESKSEATHEIIKVTGSDSDSDSSEDNANSESDSISS